MNKKNANVVMVMITAHGTNAFNCFCFPHRKLAAVTPASSHTQKSNEPACPPHRAVILRIKGMSWLITRKT